VDLSSATEILEVANRTVTIHVGVGSIEDNSFLGYEYAGTELNVYTWKNYTAHEQLEDLFWFDDSECLGSVLEAGYGNITSEYLYRYAAPLMNTGDTLLAVYDFWEQIVYLSYSEYKSGTPAYVRPMTVLNMTELFAFPPAWEVL